MIYKVSQVCEFHDEIIADSEKEAKAIFEAKLDNRVFNEEVSQVWESPKAISLEDEKANHLEALREEEYRDEYL